MSAQKARYYTEENKQARQDEVYRLHFDHGYSALKISNLMKINRKTISEDIKYLQQQEQRIEEGQDLKMAMHRLQLQQERIREAIEKAKTPGHKLSNERLLYTNLSRTAKICQSEQWQKLEFEDNQPYYDNLAIKFLRSLSDRDHFTENELLAKLIHYTGLSDVKAKMLHSRIINMGVKTKFTESFDEAVDLSIAKKYADSLKN